MALPVLTHISQILSKGAILEGIDFINVAALYMKHVGKKPNIPSSLLRSLRSLGDGHRMKQRLVTLRTIKSVLAAAIVRHFYSPYVLKGDHSTYMGDNSNIIILDPEAVIKYFKASQYCVFNDIMCGSEEISVLTSDSVLRGLVASSKEYSNWDYVIAEDFITCRELHARIDERYSEYPGGINIPVEDALYYVIIFCINAHLFNSLLQRGQSFISDFSGHTYNLLMYLKHKASLFGTAVSLYDANADAIEKYLSSYRTNKYGYLDSDLLVLDFLNHSICNDEEDFGISMFNELEGDDEDLHFPGYTRLFKASKLF